MFVRQLPNGKFSREIVKETIYSCFLKNDCNPKFLLTQFDQKLPFEWDELYIFPNSLGMGENGIFLVNKDRGFFEGIQLVFVLSGKPIYEEYESIIVDGLIDFNYLKYAINYESIDKGYYKCHRSGGVQMRYKNGIFATPTECDFIYSPNGDEEKKLIENWVKLNL